MNSEQIYEALNNLYNNMLTQYMNIQMGVNSGSLTKQQAITMLRNVAKMSKTGSVVFLKEIKYYPDHHREYAAMYEDLINQMKDYLEQELSPNRTL